MQYMAQGEFQEEDCAGLLYIRNSMDWGPLRYAYQEVAFVVHHFRSVLLKLWPGIRDRHQAPPKTERKFAY